MSRRSSMHTMTQYGTGARAGTPRAVFAADVRRGLGMTPKQLPSKYLYDALGSALFEAICHLPWYRITRAEQRLLRRHAGAVVAPLAPPAFVVELGSGSGEKVATLARSLAGRDPGAQVHLIDISQQALDLSSRTLAAVGGLQVTTHRAPYEDGLAALDRHRRVEGTALVLLLGSNIGNLEWKVALSFLASIRRSVRAGDFLLLGTDLVKPEADLLMAYDDPIGVTAAFNRNVLARMNAELGADFDLHAFEHRAIWRPEESRVEMHLVSRWDQDVRVPGAGCTVSFAEGDWIWTESSHKYEVEAVTLLGRLSGFRRWRQWIDARARFALTLFQAGD